MFMASCIHTERVKLWVKEAQFTVLKALTCSNLHTACQVILVSLVTYVVMSILYKANASGLALSDRLKFAGLVLGLVSIGHCQPWRLVKNNHR